jgi:undecaprenyl-diphosphatase
MILKILVLGVVQGLTEFLPVSSSGHLALLENLFGIAEPVTIAVYLHFGTLLATIVFFFKPIAGLIRGVIKGEVESGHYLLKIIAATIPVVIFALIFETVIKDSFKDSRVIAIFLGLTGLILLLTGLVRKRDQPVVYQNALMIGIGQMLAVFPGLSRSGLTISAGILAGVSPDKAFEFSFLLSLPAVLGANILELKDLTMISSYPGLIFGMAVSFFSGLVALAILRKLVKRYFHLFGLYCLVISLFFLLVI